MSTNSSHWILLIRLSGIGSIASLINKPVGMLVGGSGVALCKVLVGGTCIGGTCVEVAWMSGGGLGSVIIGTVPSWEAGGTMPISGWPIYGIELLIIGSQCNILLRKYKCHAFFFVCFFCGGVPYCVYMPCLPCCYVLVGLTAYTAGQVACC